MSSPAQDFAGKVALVTGGGKGIGGAISAVLAAREQLVADVKSKFGDVDLLVNNAAYAKIQDPHELSLRTWKSMLAANLDAAFHLTWLVKDDMLAKGRGGIVNISSNSAERPSVESLAYGTTKAALNAFTARASLALATTVRINGVSPSFTETPRVASVDEATQSQLREGIPIGRMGTSEEIVEMTCYLLSDKAAYITGQTFSVSGGPS